MSVVQIQNGPYLETATGLYRGLVYYRVEQ